MFRFLESDYLGLVQRLFSMFPQGGPGVALLLLRISVAATFLINAANRPRVSGTPLLFAGVLLVSASLAIGFLTPYLAVVTFVAAVASLVVGPNSSNFIFVFSIVDSLALALLGPGAYSLDARLFGRRVTVVPRRNGKSRPKLG